MINIEEEFDKLRQLVLDQIQSKEDAGEYSSTEADNLRRLVDGQMTSNCPEGHFGDCGWSSSMGYHC
jgi:hypothetical protein